LADNCQLKPLTVPLQAQFSNLVKTGENLYQFLSANSGEIQQNIIFEGVSFLEEVHRKSSQSDILLKAVKLLYFKTGSIFQAIYLLEKIDKQSHFEEKDKQIEVQIREAHHLLVRGVSIPARQPNPLYRVKSDKVMYCLDSSPAFTINGYTSRSHGICFGIQKAGYQVEAATRPGYPWEKPSLSSSLPKGDRLERKQGDIVYTALNGPKINHQGLATYMEIASDIFLREAQGKRVEIIHSASNHYTALPALVAARRLGLPFVYEVRGLWEITQASNVPGWEESDRYKLAVKLETLVAQESDRVVAITNELKEELVRRGVASEKISVIPNCVDTERFVPQQKDEDLARQIGLSLDTPIIGFAGSIVEYEGLDLLIEALAKLRQENIDFQFLLVGDGKSLPKLKQLAQNRGIDDVCYFTGRVPFEQVNSYLSLVDIAPCPRRSTAITEIVSPLKPLETMAMGKAVLLSDVAPHCSLIEDGKTGVLFSKGNVDNLAIKLKKLLLEPQYREFLGKEARQWIVTNRTWSKAGELFKSVYQQAKKDFNRHTQHIKQEGKIRNLQDLNLAVILDRFTFDTIEPEAKVFPITPENWQQVFSQNSIDALVVESAWEGNGGVWHRKVGKYEDEEFRPLRELLEYCRKAKIPTIFWNKEDPVHFNRFKVTASLFDCVFTTDANRLEAYRALPDNKINVVGSLPFFVQPQIHNPIPNLNLNTTVCYGGTYYGKRYPERTVYLDILLEAAVPHGLTIYDRQHDKPDSPYSFPEKLSPYVQGGLDYSEMVEAYKTHPVHLNVNSVMDSPTMFSRRVLEVLACGSAVVSGPGVGVSRVMQDLIPMATTQQAAEKLLNALMKDEIWRRKVVARGSRHVFRNHTASHRLVQMLRTAGLILEAPTLDTYGLVVSHLDSSSATRIAAQSISPALVLTEELEAGSEQILEKVGCQVIIFSREDSEQTVVDKIGIDWLGVFSPDKEYPETFYEDLLHATLYCDRSVLGWVPVQSQHWQKSRLPLVTLEGKPDRDRSLVDANRVVRYGLASLSELVESLGKAIESQPVLNLIDTDAVLENTPEVQPSSTSQTSSSLQLPATPKEVKTILVAGHDLKFINKIFAEMEKQRYRILIDQWQGHNKHNAEASRSLLTQADVVFCEWLLGNAVWYSNNKHPQQRLIGRLHGQEIRSKVKYLEQIDFATFSRIIFVGPHVMRHVESQYPLSKEQSIIIPNAVDTKTLNKPKIGDFIHNIGMVGIVPKLKRFDLALDILELLRKQNPSFQLYIKGKLPHEYSWMQNMPDELAYYEHQYERIRQNPLLKDSVHFDGWGNDMPEWYQKIGFVLSLSDFESFHLSVADGAASGAIPIVLPWEGAKEIYPSYWISETIDDAVEKIEQIGSDIEIHKTQSHQYKKYSQKYFNLNFIATQILSELTKL
jgi:glycosyltransferase involved in cell wall biosynthesis/spore maturation protein CgeB